MENVKITEEQAKSLKLFAYYAQSYGKKEVNTSIYTQDCTEDWRDHEWYSEGSSLESYDAIDKVIDEIITENDLISESVSDCDNRGQLYINIDCVERKLKITASETVMGSNEMGDEVTEDGLPSPVIEFLNELNSEGVSEGKVNFYGGGDSGEIENNLTSNKGNFKIERGVEDFLYRWLSEFYGGWEINEGSHGDFVFYTDNNSIQLNFNEHTENEEDLGQVFYTEF
jgi:hypothetical protein